MNDYDNETKELQEKIQRVLKLEYEEMQFYGRSAHEDSKQKHKIESEIEEDQRSRLRLLRQNSSSRSLSVDKEIERLELRIDANKSIANYLESEINRKLAIIAAIQRDIDYTLVRLGFQGLYRFKKAKKTRR